ncbi:hypothetical protein [Aureibacter tunicatorum]|uniref:Uncharacterized protein n=1 Tax=Aureibacter tunicatorum TaxID=866807 RepID=A0AAE4BSY6_9BACT|nr:hypothetical protein [Aureibacter tunicatorum]MDR6238902.1 hypothetical protein [Aureibacter tunicatorum]BDD05171.1 hypothetical protein AUTU_26540 [Aureibacter tunicatorum]
MKIQHATFILILLNSVAFGQIKLKDLNGGWKVANDYKSDTIICYNDINFRSNSCMQIVWKIKSSNLKIHQTNICIEPPISSSSIYKEKIHLKNTDHGQFLYLIRNNEFIDKFKILEYKQLENNNNLTPSKQLKLLRIDKI